MFTQTSYSIVLGLYFLIYMLGMIGIWRWRLNRRQERPPVELKLLRGPGESLRQKLESYDKDLLLNLMISAFAPLLVMGFGLSATALLPAASQLWMLLFTGALTIACLTYGARRLFKVLNERRNHYLGYFGERVVGEYLDALRPRGFHVFHDLPVQEGGRLFNIDHVVVGPSGVFAIETKTRRKGRSRPGFIDYKVILDGCKLIYPWGNDEHGIKQAQRNAIWLEKYIQQLLGIHTRVQPILTLPGWFIEERARNGLRVTNPKNLHAIIAAENAPLALQPDQIDHIRRQLDARCRDVEF